MADLNILTEDVISLSEVRKCLPKVGGQKRPHISTIWRWTLRGVGGVKLETVKIGSRILTSKQAVTRFISATTENRR
ncbi:hypothetical protein Q31b_16800 [Novipirellula aureliae]|uniref:DUF1580 domain-containing protein n=1 Tax=Novipirellula aureliae TaxID=2527966 RepID=A0A5C6E6B8_9BACT|nr:DUF1580 domain-containing protein [Novipirellula aureliae]TWU44144.1 hypothetical protein Q31b_16800 [Novipirellula aureliae]